jgi:hypothetical protein
VTLFGVALFLGAASAEGAPPWVDRPLTLPQWNVAIDGGFALAQAPRYDQVADSFVGTGANLEGAVGITNGLTAGLRFGARFDVDGRYANADAYARTFDTETFDTLLDNITDPELILRGKVYELGVAEFGLEGRIYLPIEHNANEGVMVGAPVIVHIEHVLRIDTGIYLPVLLYAPVIGIFSLPVHVWYQASPQFWLGALTGLRIGEPALVVNQTGAHYVTKGNLAGAPPHWRGASPAVAAGVGFGYQPISALDFRAMVLAPSIADALDSFGFGIGAEFRIE